MAKTVEKDEVRLSNEAQRVLQWRYNWLIAAGYSHDNANTIAIRADIDWHDAGDLLRACGNEEQALTILL